MDRDYRYNDTYDNRWARLNIEDYPVKTYKQGEYENWTPNFEGCVFKYFTRAGRIVLYPDWMVKAAKDSNASDADFYVRLPDHVTFTTKLRTSISKVGDAMAAHE